MFSSRTAISAAVGCALVAPLFMFGGAVAGNAGTSVSVVSASGFTENGIPPNGEVYVGAATTTSYPAFENEMGGTTGVHRTYYQSSGVSSAVNTAMADHAAGRVPWLSFKLPHSWAEMKNGAGDAWAQDLANKLGALDGPVWVAFHHEPEGDGPPADWVAIQQRLSPIFRAKPNIAYSIILMGWNQFYGTNPDHSLNTLWPGKEHVDILGFDPYNWYDTTNNGSGKKSYTWTELDEYYAKITTWLANTGNSEVEWAIAETGYSDSAASATQNMLAPNGKRVSTRGPGSEWLSRAYDDMRARGGIALSYFNVTAATNNEPEDWTWLLYHDKKKPIFSGLLDRAARYGVPGSNPSPSATPAPTLTPTPSPPSSAAPTPAPSPSKTATPTPTAKPTPSPTKTATPVPSQPAPSAKPTPSPTTATKPPKRPKAVRSLRVKVSKNGEGSVSWRAPTAPVMGYIVRMGAGKKAMVSELKWEAQSAPTASFRAKKGYYTVQVASYSEGGFSSIRSKTVRVR